MNGIKLIDKMLRRSKVILNGLLRVGSSKEDRDQLRDIEANLRDYNEYGLQLIPRLYYCPPFLQSPWKNSRSAQDACVKEHV